MKANPIGSITLASLLLAAAASAEEPELYSVNLWNVGKTHNTNGASVWANPDPAIKATNIATLTIENGETAGVWDTTAWQNINIGSISGTGLTINGSKGGTATFKTITKQAQSPYRWAVLRDGTSAVTPANEAYMNNGNATLLDCRLFGTDNGTDAKIEVSGITLPLYDVIIYLSMSAEAGQYGAGATLGKGFIDFDSSIVNPGLTSWFISPTPPTQTSTTLTEIVGDGGTGNYVHYKNVSGSTFTAIAYGAGTNSAGFAGIQIREVEATIGAVDPAVSTVAASPVLVPADGSATSMVTVTLKDANGLPVSGKEVTLAGVPGNATIAPPSPVTTDVSGIATFTVSSTTPGTEVFTATNVTDSNMVITQTASVNFLEAATPLAIKFNVYNLQGTPTLDDPATLEGPAGGLGQTWNQSNSTSPVGNLLSSTGVLTGVGVTFSGNGRWVIGNPANSLKMLRAGAGQSDIAQPLNLTVSGLVPDSFFDVFLASARTDGVEPSTGTWSTTNETLSSSSQAVGNVGNLNGNTWVAGNNFVAFAKVKVNGSGQIVFSGASGANRLFLNGLQLVPASAPIAYISSFGIPGWPGVIDQDAKTIALTVPTGTNLATLAPTFALYSGTCTQTSGAPPSPTFASANPATYTVTDESTEPDTVRAYTVTVTVKPTLGSLVIDLGTSPLGTAIEGGSYIGAGPVNLPLPTLPPGSILRSIAVDTLLEATDNDNMSSGLAVLLDPTPGTPGGDFSVEITNGAMVFGGAVKLGWPASANNGVGTVLADTKTDAAWAAAGQIDLSTTGLFLGNAYQNGSWVSPEGGTWSGTITLTYDVQGGGSAYQTWAGDEGFDADKNGDGVANGLAFLLGADDPNADAIGRLPAVSENAGGLVLTFTVLNRDNRGPALASVQWSKDLGLTDPWAANSAAVPETTSVVNGVSFQVMPNGNLNNIVATIPFTEGAAGKLFARLAGTEN